MGGSARARAWWWVAAVAACLAVGVATALQGYLVATMRGPRAAGEALARLVVMQTLAALAWVPVGAVAVFLARRFPLGASTWRRHLPLHLVAAAATSPLLNVVISTLWWVAGLPLPGGFVALTVSQSLAYLHVNALVYGIIVGVAHLLAYREAARARDLHAARLEAQLARARLHALRAQLHPHFLFNALHTVGLLFRTNRPEEGYDTLERLGAILRRMLDGADEHEVPLGEELDFAREYLAIERTRLRDRLRVEVDAAPDALAARVPALLLQPLVENAVRHGIAPHSAAGRLTIRAWRDGATLRLLVRDDGPGPAHGNGHASEGVGLRNTRERLRQLYGDAHRLTVGAPLEGGCVVEVALPFRERSAEG